MTPLLLITLQAETSPAPPRDVRTIDFDLARYRPRSDCAPAEAEAITVCGRRPLSTAYPLERMAKIFESGPLDTETGLGGNMRGGVYLKQVEFPNGEVSRRILVGIKLPF
jgi:hypothetical protein